MKPFPLKQCVQALCAYPQYAHYKGTGNPEDASHFSCR